LPTPEPVALPDIFARIDSLELHIPETEKSIERTDAEGAIQEEFERGRSGIQSLLDSTESSLKSDSLVLEGVSAASARVSERQEQLDGWRATLQERLEELGKVQATIEKQIQEWRQTKFDLKKAKETTPQTLVERIAAVLGTLEKLRDLVQIRLNELLSRRLEIETLRKRGESVLAEIADFRSKLRQQLLVQDARPFYQSNSIDYTADHDVSEGPWFRGQDIKAFFQTNRYSFIIPAIVGLFVWFLAIRGRRESRLSLPMMITRRAPYAAATVVAALVGGIFLPSVPVTVAISGQLLLSFPIALVLLRIVPTRHAGVGILWWLYLVLGQIGMILQLGGRMQALMLSAVALLGVISSWYSRNSVVGADLRSNVGAPSMKRMVAGQAFTLIAWIHVVVLILFCCGFWRGARFALHACDQVLFWSLVLAIGGEFLIEVFVSVLNSRLFAGFQVLSVHRVQIERGVIRWAKIAAGCAWLWRVLSSVGVERETFQWFKDIADMGLRAGPAFISIGGVAMAIAVLYAASLLSRWIRTVLEADVFSRYEVDRGLRYALDRSVNYSALIFGGIIAVGFFGIDIRSIAIVAGALSVGMGFGLQNLVNNITGGVIVLAERSIKVGDLVSVSGVSGVVSKVSLRATTIKAGDESEIIIPNSKLVGEQVVNWTLSSSRARIVVQVTVTPDVALDKCIEVLKQAAAAVPLLLRDPVPDVALKGFSDSGLALQVGAWVDDALNRGVRESELLLSIFYHLKQAGIPIAFSKRIRLDRN
jgi:small-conductance mechanosensitive channel